MNWRKIKAEYIAGGISQRALAEKYGIAWGTLRRRAFEEKWNAKRKKAETKAEQKVEQKTAEIVADNATLCEQIKTELLKKLALMVQNFPVEAFAGEKKVRTFSKTQHTEYIYRLRDIAAVYEALSDKTAKGQVMDAEDLSPLAELLKL